MAEPPDLVNAYHLLLCCIHFLLINVPDRLCNPHNGMLAKTNALLDLLVPFKQDFRLKTAQDDEIIDEDPSSQPGEILNYLCEQSGANYTEVSVVQETLFAPFLKQVL